MIKSCSRSLWLVLITGLIIAAWLTTQFQDQTIAAHLLQDEPGASSDIALFKTVTAPQRVAAPDTPLALRSRLVEVNFDVLAGANGAGKRLQLDLFPDKRFVAVYERIEQNLSGSFTWVGRLEGIEYSIVLFVVRGGQMVGLVAAPGESFALRHVAGDVHAVLQVDESALVLGPDDAIVPPALDASRDRQPASAAGYADDGSVIDVMVVYSAEAIAENPTIVSDIELAVAYTNQAYINSNINQRLALVHTAQVAYNGPRDSLSSVLSALRNVDGYIDEVHTWRDAYHADLVAIVIGDIPGESAAGRGYQLLDSSRSDNHTWGFCALQDISMAGRGVLAHELGHNMGSHHDWYEEGPTTTIYPYARGYVDPDAGFRTIMAYGSLCTALGRSCPSLPYFSNPDLSYRDAPLGVPAGTSTSCPAGNVANYKCDADSHRALNNTASIVAGYRSSENVWSGAVSDQWAVEGNWSGPVPRPIDDVRIPAGAPHNPTISGDTDVRSVLIEDGATLEIQSGTLRVWGDWEERGSGKTTISGGTLVFAGNIEQSIKTSAHSYFPHVQIGDDTSQTVTLLGDARIVGNLTLQGDASLATGNHSLHVGGDLTIQDNASLAATSGNLYVAGNWASWAGGFAPQSSTVNLNGGSQSLEITASGTVLDEPFEETEGQEVYTNLGIPAGWATESAASDAPYFVFGRGEAAAWHYVSNSTNATGVWLFSSPVTLQPEFTYRVTFDYKTSSGYAQNFKVYVGAAQGSSAMLAGTNVLEVIETTNTTYATASNTFSVNQAGTYYLGFLHQEDPSFKSIGFLDNISLTIVNQELHFYNLVVSGGETSLDSDIVVHNDLTLSGGVLDVGTHDLSVEGAVEHRNGAFRQSQNAPGGSTASFLRITNAAGDMTKYFGVDITPDSNMGNTTVSVRRVTWPSSGGYSFPAMSRVFEIAPTTPQDARIQFWFTEADRNYQAANDLSLWHYHSGSLWIPPGDSYMYSENSEACQSAGGTACWFQADNVSNYQYPFVLGSGAQVEITSVYLPLVLRNLGAVAPSINFPPLANDDTFSVDENSSNNALNVLDNDSDPDGDPISIVTFGEPGNGALDNVGDILYYTPDSDYYGTDTFTYTLGDDQGATDVANVAVVVLPPNPLIQSIHPAANSHTATLSTGVSATYNKNINAASVSTRTFAVHAMQTGLLLGDYDVSGGQVSLNPPAPFKPGEPVQVSASGGIYDLAGEPSLSPTAWQFHVAAWGGSGDFEQSIPSLNSSGQASEVAWGDVNGDGHLDLVAGYAYNSTPSVDTVYLNAGGGTFSDTHAIGEYLEQTASVALGDVDGDGDLDVVAGRMYVTQNAVYLNAGDGQFPTTLPFGSGDPTIIALALGDVDNDADLDIVAANGFYQGPDTLLYLNAGDGTFPSETAFGASEPASSVALGDLDGDGWLDIVLGKDGQNLIYRNAGDGTFAAGVSLSSYQTDDATFNVALGDMDNDGHLDVVVGNSGDPHVVYLNAGDGTFDAPRTVSADTANAAYLALGDVDGDGDLDIAVSNYHETTYTQDNLVYLNDGDANFTAGDDFGSATDHPSRMTLGDVDGDGDLDLAVGITVYTNQGAAVNTPPVALDDAYNANAGVALSVPAPGVLDNDSDDDGDTLTAVQDDAPSHGALTLNSDGSFVYTPAPGFTGADSFTYHANDGWADSNVATVAITVATAPLAQSIHPPGNAHTASLTTSVRIVYDQSMDAATVSTRTFALHAMQTGLLTGTYSVNGGAVTLTPARSFKPGELAQASASAGMRSVDGIAPLPLVWQFRAAAVVSSTGVFSAHPTTPEFGLDYSFGLALGDINGDGFLDAIIANDGSQTVWLNDGAGNLSAHPTTPTFGDADLASSGIALGDLDGDGDLDVVMANYYNDSGGDTPNTVWLNDGQGNYSAHPTTPSFTHSTYPNFGIDLGDLDGDGDLDAVAANRYVQTVWLNAGGGNFSAHPSTPTLDGSISEDLALGDLDGDGDLDLVVAQGDGNPQTVWLNAGGGNFSAHPTTPSFGAGNTQSVSLGDLDGDGDLDVIAANYYPDEKTVWVNDGNGNFSAHPTTPSFDDSPAYQVALGDIDGDGDLDAVIPNSGQAHKVWLNDGSGNYSPHPTAPSFGGGHTSRGLFLGDIDNDGDLDAVIANGFDQANTVWLNAGSGTVILPPRANRR